MKPLNNSDEPFAYFTILDEADLDLVNGGGFWEDLAYVFGYTARKIFEFSKEASKHSDQFLASPIGASSAGACNCNTRP